MTLEQVARVCVCLYIALQLQHRRARVDISRTHTHTLTQVIEIIQRNERGRQGKARAMIIKDQREDEKRRHNYSASQVSVSEHACKNRTESIDLL